MEHEARRELTAEEKMWCLEQAIAVIKEACHGGASNMRDVTNTLQSVYQLLCALRQNIKEGA
ncbi:MAG: hypothetical protein KatS3mg131_1015 [Candidatus Tectimicrobiota bacterium]|nr:MAG: hypothetical protein KatS3mg131_1015 [Candidatus Tectomicrobia bacterium]